jgi:hypothetical protein
LLPRPLFPRTIIGRTGAGGGDEFATTRGATPGGGGGAENVGIGEGGKCEATEADGGSGVTKGGATKEAGGGIAVDAAGRGDEEEAKRVGWRSWLCIFRSITCRYAFGQSGALQRYIISRFPSIITGTGASQPSFIVRGLKVVSFLPSSSSSSSPEYDLFAIKTSCVGCFVTRERE